MKITVVQSDPVWENSNASLARLDELLNKEKVGADIYVLPEMFNTGFTVNAEATAEATDGPTLAWMKEKAALFSAVIAGSIAVREEGRFFNRMLFVRPDGSWSFYDKRHLHSPGGEDIAFTPGKKRVTCRHGDMNFNLQICYDLRFPVWARNTDSTDVIIYPASWPEARIYAWKSLLIARAIENQCYVIGANRVGTSPDGTKYCGESLIIDPLGKILSSLPHYEEGLLSSEISKDYIEKIRKTLPALKDADDFRITL